MKALIVEDSRLARLELIELLKHHAFVEVIGEASNVTDAVEMASSLRPDLLLLDINLPDGTGFDVLKQLSSVPQVIFTTAYDEFAIKAFEVNALDYLMKPIHPERLAKALDKLDRSAEKEKSESLSEDSKVFVKDGQKCWLVKIKEIRYFMSSGNHAQVFFDNVKPFIYQSLSKLEEKLPSQLFFRVSRQFIVNLNEIKSIDPWDNGGFVLTMTDEREIEVSRRYASILRSALSI
ncbi:LytR/AlgR family response regulator transcription factor [Pleionea sediminis]|uniref:LytR/AlgR family response regulator transcription factor n=1 Tax=Pleionea sediminis TaxID=2569479 RepID=UPI001185F7DB|nr:LytTR family DNA-binding domain-containing protein [Pleionea sediminis]